MITTPESNVKLSDEQTKQLHEFYSRLTNLQTETSIATKNLENIKQENLKAAIEKNYLEETIESLKNKVKEFGAQADEHSQLVSRSHEELRIHRKERSDADDVHAIKREELGKRAKDVEEREQAHQTQVADFSHKLRALSEDKLSVEQAKEAFLKALESVKWK